MPSRRNINKGRSRHIKVGRPFRPNVTQNGGRPDRSRWDEYPSGWYPGDTGVHNWAQVGYDYGADKASVGATLITNHQCNFNNNPSIENLPNCLGSDISISPNNLQNEINNIDGNPDCPCVIHLEEGNFTLSEPIKLNKSGVYISGNNKYVNSGFGNNDNVTGTSIYFNVDNDEPVGGIQIGKDVEVISEHEYVTSEWEEAATHSAGFISAAADDDNFQNKLIQIWVKPTTDFTRYYETDNWDEWTEFGITNNYLLFATRKVISIENSGEHKQFYFDVPLRHAFTKYLFKEYKIKIVNYVENSGISNLNLSNTTNWNDSYNSGEDSSSTKLIYMKGCLDCVIEHVKTFSPALDDNFHVDDKQKYDVDNSSTIPSGGYTDILELIKDTLPQYDNLFDLSDALFKNRESEGGWLDSNPTNKSVGMYDGVPRGHHRNYGIEVYESKNCTIRNVYIGGAQARGDGGKGYGLLITGGSNEILVYDVVSVYNRHNFIVSNDTYKWFTSGIVFNKCSSSNGWTFPDASFDFWSRYQQLEIFGLGAPGLNDTHKYLSPAILVSEGNYWDGWQFMNRSKWSSNAGMTTVGSILWNTKGYDYYSQPWEFASNPRSLVSYQADLPDQTGGIVGGLNMVAYTDNFSKYDYINELIRTTSQLYGQSSLVQGANNGSDKMIVESNLFSQFTNTITSNIDWPNYLSSNGCAQPGDTNCWGYITHEGGDSCNQGDTVSGYILYDTVGPNTMNCLSDTDAGRIGVRDLTLKDFNFSLEWPLNGNVNEAAVKITVEGVHAKLHNKQCAFVVVECNRANLCIGNTSGIEQWNHNTLSGRECSSSNTKALEVDLIATLLFDDDGNLLPGYPKFNLPTTEYQANVGSGNINGAGTWNYISFEGEFKDMMKTFVADAIIQYTEEFVSNHDFSNSGNAIIENLSWSNISDLNTTTTWEDWAVGGGDLTEQIQDAINNFQGPGNKKPDAFVNSSVSPTNLYEHQRDNYGDVIPFDLPVHDVYRAGICPGAGVGDINGDGGYNVLDVVALVNIALGGSGCDTCADMNGDGGCNVLDVVALVNCVLAGGNCGALQGRPDLDTPDRYLPPKGMSERVHTKILKELASGKMNLNQMNRYLRRKIPKKIRGV